METIAHTLATADECRKEARLTDHPARKRFYLDLQRQLLEIATAKQWLHESAADDGAERHRRRQTVDTRSA
jgi:hypothetical protein